MQLYIDTANTSLGVRNSTFHIKNGKTARMISPKRVSSIAILSNVSINTSAIRLAAEHEIPIFYHGYTGKLLAQLRGPSFLKHAGLRARQMQFMRTAAGMRWALGELNLKTTLQMETLRRGARRHSVKDEEVDGAIKLMQAKMETLEQLDLSTKDIYQSIMGVEGGIARVYFKTLSALLPGQYQFKRRSRRPGRDYFNTALNYIYGLTYGHITKAVHAAGLDSFMGALHRTPYREALVYDCIEPFRPIMDRLLLALCEEHALTATHFKKVKGGFWLSRQGKKLVVPRYADHLQARIKIDANVSSIQNHMYARARLLKEQIQESDVPTFL